MRRFVSACIILFGLQGLFAEELTYTLHIDDKAFDAFHVEIKIDDVNADRFVFSMPRWIPGTYFIGEYGKYVYNFSARDVNDTALSVLRLNQNDWEVTTNGSYKIDVSYDIETRQRGFMGNPLDSTGALVQGATTWMYVRGLEHLPCRLEIDAPETWQAATGLVATEFPCSFRARNYDELADCPLMLGDLERHKFKHNDIPHFVVFRNNAEFDRKRFIDMVQDIVRYQVDLFGELAYDKYVFLYTLASGHHGGGGLEHANSTTISLSALNLMNNIYSAANVTAHEFFHVWNVKRITARALMPLNYSREARTDMLWWLEGVTSYYADLTLLRTGIWTFEEFLKSQQNCIQKLQGNPDRLETPVSQASWDVWEDGFMSSGISVYTKGQLLGLLLDLMIRKNTENKRSLDDVFRYLNIHYARRGIGVGSADLLKALEIVAAMDFQPFFDRYVTGVVELPYQSVLATAGLNIDLQKQPQPFIGHIRLLGPRHRVFSIDAQSPAAKAGLRRNDFIRAVDSVDIKSRKQFIDYVRKKSIGDSITIHIERDAVDLVLNLPVQSYQKVICTLEKNPSAAAEALELRRNWINGG